MASCVASMLALSGRMTSTRRWRFTSDTVAPSIKPRSSRSRSPARNTGASASKGRHKAISWTWIADIAIWVNRPARSSLLQHRHPNLLVVPAHQLFGDVVRAGFGLGFIDGLLDGPA